MTRPITAGSVRCLAAITALLLSGWPAHAQITTGSVAGTVRDAQGGVIPGATVALVHEAHGTRSAPVITSAANNYQAPRTVQAEIRFSF